MTKLKKALSIILVFAIVLTLTPMQANAAKKAKLNKSKLSLYVGKSYTLKLKNNKKKIKWSSSKKKVATVSSKGKVKAKKKGSCKITAKVGKKKYVCKVKVKKANKRSSNITPSPTNYKNNFTPTTKPISTQTPNITSPEPTEKPTITPSPEPSATPTAIPDYTLHNPTVDDKTSVWDLIEFGSFPQSLYTPIKEPDNPEDNVTYIDSDGTSYLCRSKSVTTSKRVLNEETQTYETINTTTTNYYYYKYEPIQWRVLNVSDGKALLLADKCLDYSPYHSTWEEVTWETCSLRKYLNSKFKETAFSQTEQELIEPTNVINTRANPYSQASGGNNTIDEVFLLDIYETTKRDYGFCEEPDDVAKTIYEYDSGMLSNTRKCVYTDYTNDGGTYDFKTEYLYSSCWWLRSPGVSLCDTTHYATYVQYGCIFYTDDFIKPLYTMAVRPAITINIEDDSTIYNKVGTVDADYNYVIY